MQTELKHDPFDTSLRDEADATRKEAEALALINEVNDWGWLMSGKRGRRIVRRLLTMTHQSEPSFNPESERLSAFREGERNVGLRLTALLTSNFPGDYLAMLQENLSE